MRANPIEAFRSQGKGGAVQRLLRDRREEFSQGMKIYLLDTSALLPAPGRTIGAILGWSSPPAGAGP